MSKRQSSGSRCPDRFTTPLISRRRLLRTGALTLAGGFAGCGGDGGNGDGGTEGGATDVGTTVSEAGGGDTSTETPESTQTPVPQGADVLGGPNDLQSRAEVRATVLKEDQGAGRYVFTPAVVWLERGGTVVWNFKKTDHTVTVYHPQYDKPQRIPDDVETPFNSEFSGVGAPGTSFNFVFNVEGVWNYFCKPHEGSGMVGMVIVGEPKGGAGASPPTDVKSAAAAEKLGRLLEVTGVGESGDTGGSSDVVKIPRYEFSAGESYTFDIFFQSSDGARESTDTWAVQSVEGDDVTVKVTSEVDGETSTTTLTGTHDTIYDAAENQLFFNPFAIARGPLRIAEMGELTAGNSFTIQRGQFPSEDTINWETATVEVAGETSVNGVSCTEFTLRPDGMDQLQTACVADGYPFALSVQVKQAGTTTIELTLTDSTRP